MNFLNALQVLSVVVALTGCGQAPAPGGLSVAGTNAVTPTDPGQPGVTPSPIPTASPTSTPVTVQNFAFNNSVGICNAVDTWNPQTTTLIFPTNAGATNYYVFEEAGVMIADSNQVVIGKAATGAPAIIQKIGMPGNNLAVVCTITVDDGALVGVQ